MDKHPKEMTNKELVNKMKEDGVNAKAANAVVEAGIDGKLLWLMVEDFNEFSAIVTNPVERLHLRQFVKTYSIHTGQMPSMKGIQDEVDTDLSSLDDSDAEFPKESTSTINTSPKPTESANTGKKRPLDSCDTAPLAKRSSMGELDSQIGKSTSSRFDGTTTIRLPETFSRRVSIAIDNDQLVAENRSAFIRECVDFFEPVLPNPSKKQFDEICSRLCDKYPSLKDAKKTIYWGTLKDQITQRFRNSRRKTAAAKSHKIVLPSTRESSALEPASPSPSNDHEMEEYDENVAALKKLSKIKSPPAQTIQDLLKATRELRLKWLSSSPVSIHDIIEKYPVLAKPKWLLHEFNSMEGKDMLDTMKTNWKQICDQLNTDSELASAAGEKKVLLKVEKNVYHRKTASPIVIAEASGDIDNHFKSKIMEPRLIIFEEDDTIVQMFIAGEDDNLMELPVISIGEGIVYLMAAYYVFSVEYPNPYKPLLFFFQDFIMDKADNGKRPTRYATFAATITQ